MKQKEILHTVDYRKPKYSTVYVTPEGSDAGNGSRQNPLSLTQALRYAYAGQTPSWRLNLFLRKRIDDSKRR